MGKCSNAFFSETTNMINAKLYMNVHWMVLYKLYVFLPMNIHVHLALIIFVVSEKKAFEHFPKGSNVKLCPDVAAILNFISEQKT
jgi:Ulp1 family protease